MNNLDNHGTENWLQGETHYLWITDLALKLFEVVLCFYAAYAHNLPFESNLIIEHWTTLDAAIQIAFAILIHIRTLRTMLLQVPF